jgi:tetratricopeptide (TPR) repeat protein
MRAAGWPSDAAPAAHPAGAELETARRPLLRDNAADDIRAGRFALARGQLDRLRATGPEDPAIVLLVGELHRLQAQRAATPEERLAQFRQARESYTRALRLDPALAEPHRQLGLLYYQQQDLARARAELQEYLRLAGGAPDAARIGEYVRELAR